MQRYTMKRNSAYYYEELDKRLEKTVLERSLHGLMSDAKWIKLVGHLVQNVSIKKVEFKGILDEKEGVLNISADMAFELDYWKNGFEGSNSSGGWLMYKEIEYLRFPAVFIGKGGMPESQNIAEIEEAISSVGMFEVHIENGNLILLCYK